MGGVIALLNEAEAAGLHVARDGDKLRITGPRTAAAIAQQLIARKPDVLDVLHGRARCLLLAAEGCWPAVKVWGVTIGPGEAAWCRYIPGCEALCLGAISGQLQRVLAGVPAGESYADWMGKPLPERAPEWLTADGPHSMKDAA